LSLWAFVQLYKHADESERLTSAIVLTIAAAVVHGLAMSVGLVT
jgi:hypothetical protein